MEVLPIEIHGVPSTLTNECIGPVPEDETLMMGSIPKVSAPESATCFTKG